MATVPAVIALVAREEVESSPVPGMAAVMARMQSYVKTRAELPPPYEAPPSYSAAIAMSLPPPYTQQPPIVRREAIIV